jgi:hypothetical protein
MNQPPANPIRYVAIIFPMICALGSLLASRVAMQASRQNLVLPRQQMQQQQFQGLHDREPLGGR